MTVDDKMKPMIL